MRFFILLCLCMATASAQICYPELPGSPIVLNMFDAVGSAYGTLTLTVQGHNLVGTFESDAGQNCKLNKVQMWAGITDLSMMPQDAFGCPLLPNLDCVSPSMVATSYRCEVSIPCPNPDELLNVVAHAKITCGGVSHSTWSDGPPFVMASPGWGTVSQVTLSCPCTSSCPETAFAIYGQAHQCFIGIAGVQGNSWGWTNGPLDVGSYVMDIYAGAGQCNLGNGAPVGQLFVNYDGSQVTVTYQLAAGVAMDTTHVFVGQNGEFLPPWTGGGAFLYSTNKGDYGNENINVAVNSDVFVIAVDYSGAPLAGGPIYIVAHAENVCY